MDATDTLIILESIKFIKDTNLNNGEQFQKEMFHNMGQENTYRVTICQLNVE